MTYGHSSTGSDGGHRIYSLVIRGLQNMSLPTDVSTIDLLGFSPLRDVVTLDSIN
jgi:hypothetical protein